MNQRPRTITERNVLAVEGEDERNFFSVLLPHMGILGVQIEPVGGKNQFKDKLPALVRTPGFSLVEYLAIVRDRDDDDAFESIVTAVRRANLVPPCQPVQYSDGIPHVGVFIMLGGTIGGTMLEDLCLETVQDRPAMICVRRFSECTQDLSEPPRSPSKAKCQAFLAAQVEIANTVGVGAQKGYWNLDSPCLDDLKMFLSQMR